MTAKKKSFRDDISPAMNFISQESIEKVEQAEKPLQQKEEGKTISEIRKEAPEGYKVNPLYIETRSKRIQCLLQPSLYDKLKDKAETEGVSVNEVINSILLDAFKE